MKQKIHQSESSIVNGVKAPSTDDGHEDAGTKTVMLSHVPVSIGSRTDPSSTNSSISSKGDDAINDTQDKAKELNTVGVVPPENVTVVVSDSSNESSRHEVMPQNKISVPVSSSSSNLDKVKPMQPPPPMLNRLKVLSRKDPCDQQDTASGPQQKKARLDEGPCRPIAPSPASMVLLGCEQDESVLNPLHAFIRKQIEVFTATAVELQQPAPGRKQPIKLHQVGLRCIHCRNQANLKRVKRAVCYPSSVGRVYHSVSDMKFDHFSHCRAMPPDVRAQFEKLKSEGKRNQEKKSTKGYPSSTAQYYHDAALKMGMTDGPGGVFISGVLRNMVPSQYAQMSAMRHDMSMNMACFSALSGLGMPPNLAPGLLNRSMIMNLLNTHPNNSAVSSSESSLAGQGSLKSRTDLPGSSASKGQVRKTLAEASDRENLNGLHCFVRQHVEAFTADNNDISAPAPGRKTRVILGQVGIRCIHCAKLPISERVKRSVCYPPSVRGIYHSISNMKFDHFAICRGLPAEARAEFTKLKDSCSRRGTAGNNGSRGSTSSTARYYEESAMRKGLIDTDAGIRFQANVKGEDVTKPGLSVPARGTGNFFALVRAASQAA